ncbi:glucoamylase family protein, partial [Roseivirga sp. UBA1976]
MKLHYLLSLVFLSMLACSKDEPGAEPLVLKNAFAGDLELSTGSVTEGVPVDRTISLVFSAALDESTTQSGILLSENDNEVSKTISLSSQGKSALLLVNGTLKDNTLYTISINQNLKSTAGASTTPTTIQFKTLAGALSLISIEIDGETVGNNPRVQDIGVQPTITFNFSTGVSLQSFQKAFRLTGRSVSISSSDENRVVSVTPTTALDYIKKYKITLSEELKSSEGRDFEGYSLEFYTQLNPANKFPQISESELLTKVQEQTFKYFWDFAHPTSGLARERNSSGNTVTIGGSGFGVMAILVGIERGFISRQQGIDRLQTIVNFLKNADRFHGVWPHWMNGNTGKTIPFSATDDGGDLVETAFMIQGLLTVREYLNASNTQEKAIIDTITELWEEVEWDWYTRGGQNVLYWHWSPNVGWEKNLKIQGWNESLIVYVLAASSPTHPISANVYHEGWARNGNMANGEEYFGTTLPLGYSYGGPLFFSHYSFLGLDPRQLEDQYANYWDQNVAHSKINYAYAV